MKVYLLRHGETDWNKTRRIQGNADIPLNERGRAVARATAEAMQAIPFDAVFSSPLVRASETAQILMEGRGIPVQTDERLREISFGEFEGTSWPEIKHNPEYECIRRFFEEPGRYVPERGAESFESIYERAGSFIREEVLSRESSCEHMLIVAHGAFNRAFLAWVRQAGQADFWGMSRKPVKNCAACILEVQDGTITIVEEGKIYYDPALFE